MLKGLPGFTEDGEVKGDDPETAMTSLLALTPDELAAVFREAIAALCIDGFTSARPGAKGETLTILGGPEPEALHGLCTAEWLKGYSMPQLHGQRRGDVCAGFFGLIEQLRLRLRCHRRLAGRRLARRLTRQLAVRHGCARWRRQRRCARRRLLRLDR